MADFASTKCHFVALSLAFAYRLYDIMIILLLLCSMDCMTLRHRDFVPDARWTVVLGVCVLDQR
jgi:hypothetical protein